MQVAKISGTAFSMIHKMSLAQLTLPYAQLIQTRTDNNGSITDAGTVYKTASSQFASNTNTPFLYSDGGASAGKNKVLYFVFKTSATIASKTTVADAWSQDVSATSGQYVTHTINSSRTYWKYVGIYSNPGGSASAGGGYSTKAQNSYVAKDPYTVSLEPGNYKMECWGASGEDYTVTSYSPQVTYLGGHGGYVSGELLLVSSETFYVYTGNTFGYNGGMIASLGSGAGGATDVRLIKGTASGTTPNWKNFTSLKSRIMVAAGGGGGMARTDNYGDGNGGYGGGLQGGTGTVTRNTNGYGWYLSYGGGQDYNGYTTAVIPTGGYANVPNGSTWYSGYFGGNYYTRYPQWVQDGDQSHLYDYTILPQGAAGGGWYSGGACAHAGAGGGSSYISGHSGCIAVLENATESYNACMTWNQPSYKSQIQHRSDSDPIDKSTHYSGLRFTNTVMIDGEGYNWTTARGSYVGTPKFSDPNTTQAGNPDLVGYAKITTIPDD